MTATFEPTARTKVRRKADRARYDAATVHAILDEALLAHVAFTVDGQPWIVPMTYARVGDTLYFHGARANHALGALADGAPACISVTLLDGLVLSRSSFHHSMNYRSVVVFGTGHEVVDADEKHAAVQAVVEHVVPGNTGVARPPTDAELRATLVVAVPLVEASAKVRTGPPIEEPDDLALAVWAGVIPIATVFGAPVADGDVLPGVTVPAHVASYTRRRT
ncbi:MAG TPA: pyridoxamine 5'-phosphate oxidase family protein [Acidimicrobiia bacterium]|nr:pyridoxamine 5'-phosphate oxidase family protein [Acidimicrobiia bacterium]